MKNVLLKSVPLAGTAHLSDEGNRALDRVAIGDALILQRHPENKFDSNAIRVLADDPESIHKVVQVGWVPKKANKIFAVLMDGGLQLYAVCVHVDDDPSGYWIDIFWHREETAQEKAKEVVKHTKMQAKRVRV